MPPALDMYKLKLLRIAICTMLCGVFTVSNAQAVSYTHLDVYKRQALLRGLDKRLSQKIKLPVHIADDPLKTVVRGTGLALKNYLRYPFIMR